MATFNYTVDTQPMAEELKSVSRHVNATTGAVIAMQAAVIAAEETAADHVCNNVNRGFYSLIRSQISQKMAKLQSDVDSHQMQLLQQKKALLAIKNRMERDYNMIAGRYSKLFSALNNNLKSRIFELDRPTISFATKDVDKLSNRTKYLTATVPVSQLESISLSQKIIASNVKQKGLNVINSMKSFIYEMNIQKKLTDQILINDTKDAKETKAYIPIIIYESNRDKSGETSLEILAPEKKMNRPAVSEIKNKILGEIKKINLPERPSPEVVNEFKTLVKNSQRNERIKEMALKLFQSK